MAGKGRMQLSFPPFSGSIVLKCSEDAVCMHCNSSNLIRWFGEQHQTAGRGRNLRGRARWTTPTRYARHVRTFHIAASARCARSLARSHLARPSLGCVRGRYKYIFPSTSPVQSPPRVFEGVKQKREREEGREAKLCSARGIAKLTKDPDSI